MNFLLQSPQDMQATNVFIEVSFSHVDDDNKDTITTATALPVMFTNYNRGREALMLLPPYSATKSTRFGRLPQPVYSDHTLVLQSTSINRSGNCRVTLIYSDINTILQSV